MVDKHLGNSTDRASVVNKNDKNSSTLQTNQANDQFEMPKLSGDVAQELVSVFKLLSDATRLNILLHLSQKNELHVRALCDLLEQSQPAVSHHLALLRVAGMITCRRDGKHNFYSLTSKKFAELLDKVFTDVPAQQRCLRVENYALSYTSSS